MGWISALVCFVSSSKGRESKTSELGMCVRSYPGGVSSVCLVWVHGWKRELSVYSKNKQEATLWWFGAPICWHICIGMMLLKATRKQESIEVPLSALWCYIVIHDRPRQSLCFVPYHWQCSHLLDRICRVSNPHALALTLWQRNSATQRSTPTRAFSHPRHKVSQLQMFAFSEAQRLRRRSCRCHGRFKRMEQTSRRGRLLAAVPAFDERTPNQ